MIRETRHRASLLPRVLTAMLAALALALLLSPPARAQEAFLSEAAQVSLITVLPGDAVYSMYGHSAVRVYDPLRGIDVSFNYGTFAFDAWFLPNFLYGRLNYALSIQDYPAATRGYRLEGRPVIEQVLRLDAHQREAVFRYLEHNARPENRFYRYDFLFDNCSTRIRDLFETVLGDSLRFAEHEGGTRTFRQLLDPYQGSLLDTGIDLLIGAPVDRPATAREEMFLPDYLMAAFDAATIDADGTTVPLVARTDTVLWIAGYERATFRFPLASVLLWVFCLLGLGLTYRDVRTGRPIRRAIDVPLFTIVGTVGVLIVFLWFVSLHEVTERNWNLLWAWPTHLLVLASLVRRRPAAWLPRYLVAAALAAAITVLGWFAWPQHLPPAVLPVVLLLAVRSGWIGYAYVRAPHAAPVGR